LKSLHWEIVMTFRKDKEGIMSVKKTTWRPWADLSGHTHEFLRRYSCWYGIKDTWFVHSLPHTTMYRLSLRTRLLAGGFWCPTCQFVFNSIQFYVQTKNSLEPDSWIV
jgi:hypothetical protein